MCGSDSKRPKCFTNLSEQRLTLDRLSIKTYVEICFEESLNQTLTGTTLKMGEPEALTLFRNPAAHPEADILVLPASIAESSKS